MGHPFETVTKLVQISFVFTQDMVDRVWFRSGIWYQMGPLMKVILGQRLYGTGSVWNHYEMGTDKPCVYTEPFGSGTDRICYLVLNRSTYGSDPKWNNTVPVSNRTLVNRVDPYHSGSDPKWTWPYTITCKRSLYGTVPLQILTSLV